MGDTREFGGGLLVAKRTLLHCAWTLLGIWIEVSGFVDWVVVVVIANTLMKSWKRWE